MCLAGCGRVAFDPHADGGNRDGAATDAQTIASLQPLAWWKLDETSGTDLHDSVGALDGFLVPGGNTTLPTWAAVGGNDPSDYAVFFEGDGDQAPIAMPSILHNLSAVTVAGWIYPLTVTADATARCIFDKGTGGASGWAFVISPSQAPSGDGSLGFLLFGATWTMYVITGPNTISANRWTHLAMTWDGSATTTNIHFYVDGAEVAPVASMPAGGPRVDDSSNGGTINCNSGITQPGMYDDIILFDRVLTPGEVATVYGS